MKTYTDKKEFFKWMDNYQGDLRVVQTKVYDVSGECIAEIKINNQK